mmetsp:Transcript_4975/g.7350  ORF Transcript_4975/g.7350 Transcript_4975/m.7350 type:complete len:327 (+) Transcript_4975:296-1276(+)|eukprot:CAMPEP_0172415232 /NCGR_PEP_ID=MMETSP1064-20121228/1698_1 /TAXON_ID=202472 /ORGANISM="Aulacoseira subarctica , Strain CCAP 1002/5" /LENGTH=326 /DNA_ID=CAMNT_0013152157 /DNA_START=236 /DNA_END=1216 /DNA_ORIENTATION=+
MQQAALRSRNGDIQLGTIVVPTPKAGQVLLQVMAAAINPVDYKLPYMVAGKHVGIDVAGIVTASSSSIFKVGDEVFGFAAEGSLAEYAVANEEKIASKPKSISWIQAAALPVAYATSYQALTTHGNLKAGQRVLILGASGGTGTAGLLIAAALQATSIVAVCSAANKELVLSLGATSVVDYTDTDAYEAFKNSSDKFDLVYDCASSSGKQEWYLDDARKYFLKPGGKVIAINGGALQWLRAFTGLQSKDFNLILTKQSGADLTALLELLSKNNKNDFAPIIDSTFSLTSEGVVLGFERQKSRRARGKIVYTIGCDASKDSTDKNAK